MNFTHFEEGHHERLLVVRAISAYKACFSRIYTETFKSNRKVSVRETVLLDCSFQHRGIPTSSVSFTAGPDDLRGLSQPMILAHTLLLSPNTPLLPP